MIAPTIVFDIGNVLLRWDPRKLLRKTFAGDDAAMEMFLATACSPDWFLQLDAGDLSPKVPERIAAFPQDREQLMEFDGRWLETLGPVIEENVALFARLKGEGRKVYGITNYPADKFELSRPHYPFLDWFDGLVVSGREGLVKPDPRIFRLLLDRYGLHAADLLFVDDSARNVSTARDAGMAAIHFVEGVDLAREFDEHGVFA